MVNKKTIFEKIRDWGGLVALILGIIATLWGFYEKSEKERYKSNYELSVQKETSYRDKNGIMVKEVQTLILTKEDLKRSKDSTIQKLLVELDASDIKLRKTSSMVDINMTTDNGFRTMIHNDTLLTFRDSVKTTYDTSYVKKMNYKDKWIDFSATQIPNSDSINVKIITYHDLIATNSWYKEGNWKLRNLFTWRRKQYKTSVKDLNKYSTITNVKSISIGRDKP